MENIKKYKNKIIFGIIVILMLIISMIIFYKYDNDGMNNSGIHNVKYKISQNDEWTKYSKNGMVVGNKENPIQNLSIKMNETDGRIFYNVYTNKWSEQNYQAMDENVKKIYGLKIGISNTLRKKYDVCYRTYNKKDKWLNWICDGDISGNKKEPITALEIKIIPKKVIKFDYLKDYNKNLEANKNF